ncbi:MAG: HAMP domain-containing protein [Anaerolineaceae bacterium]|nr:HAMP domain-containing protein [Anaerolineaceae bacterium]
MRHSFQFRLVVTFTIIVVLVIGLFAFVVNRSVQGRFNRMVESTGRFSEERSAQIFVRYYVQTGSWDGLQEAFDRLISSGYLLSENADLQFERFGTRFEFDFREERILLFDQNNEMVLDSNPDGPKIKELESRGHRGTPILIGDEKVGTVVVTSTLGMLTSTQNRFLNGVNQVMVITAMIAILAVLIVGTVQARRVIAPVKALALASTKIADGDYDQKIEVNSKDEFGEMAQAFNKMSADLKQQRDLRHRAMADIAHELRTPLSVLQIEVESLEDGLAEPTLQTFAGLRSEVIHLKNLVEDLRVLSQVEANELSMEMVPLELRSVISDIVGRFQGKCRDKKVTLSISVPENELLVVGDDQRLVQVMLNLLSNALKYTKPGGNISVSVENHQNSAHVIVKDCGEGIPRADLPYIFNRLYRTSRSRSREKGGTGLGLSIAKGIIEAHGGRIWVESEEGKGSIFTFSLPLT